MKHWELEIKNKELAKIYDSYLYRQNDLITFYLSTVVISKHAFFPKESLDEKVRASAEFSDSATSIKLVSDVVNLVESDKYDQLSRSLCILGMATAFSDFFQEIKVLLELPDGEIKKTIEIKNSDQEVIKIRPAALKIASFVNKSRDLDSRIGDVRPLRWINCIINLRHMFIHNAGKFDEAYSGEMYASWTNKLKHNDPITFDGEQVDSILWFFNDHVRDFANKLDCSF